MSEPIHTSQTSKASFERHREKTGHKGTGYVWYISHRFYTRDRGLVKEEYLVIILR